MREAFAQDAVLILDEDADERAPGAAITVALCGSWEHEGPCPLAPHHTSADRDGGRLHIRVLYAVEPARRELVRQRIVEALASGSLTGPDGRTARWQVADTEADEIRPHEQEHAARLVSQVG